VELLESEHCDFLDRLEDFERELTLIDFNIHGKLRKRIVVEKIYVKFTIIWSWKTASPSPSSSRSSAGLVSVEEM
jgi:hypothetical protein